MTSFRSGAGLSFLIQAWMLVLSAALGHVVIDGIGLAVGGLLLVLAYSWGGRIGELSNCPYRYALGLQSRGEFFAQRLPVCGALQFLNI